MGPLSPFLAIFLVYFRGEGQRERNDIEQRRGPRRWEGESIWWRPSAWLCVFSKGSWQNESRNQLSRWWESSTFAMHLFMFRLPSCQFQLLSPYRHGLVHDYYWWYHLMKVGYFINTNCVAVNSVRQCRNLGNYMINLTWTNNLSNQLDDLE